MIITFIQHLTRKALEQGTTRTAVLGDANIDQKALTEHKTFNICSNFTCTVDCNFTV
jgi:hypothetical protein